MNSLIQRIFFSQCNVQMQSTFKDLGHFYVCPQMFGGLIIFRGTRVCSAHTHTHIQSPHGRLSRCCVEGCALTRTTRSTKSLQRVNMSHFSTESQNCPHFLTNLLPLPTRESSSKAFSHRHSWRDDSRSGFSPEEKSLRLVLAWWRVGGLVFCLSRSHGIEGNDTICTFRNTDRSTECGIWFFFFL